MNWVYDADSHVEEGEFTFGDKYWDKRFLGRRPIVVEGDSMGNLCWMADSWTFPRNVGPASATAGPPNSLKGVPSKLFHERVVKAAERGMKITLEGIEFHSTKARLDMMDQQELAVQVNFPSILLTWPFAYDPKIGAAIARSYNDHMADIASGAPDRLKWVTAIDPSDVEESVREIRRTRDMGSIGLMLLGTYGDLHLDHPVLDPIWRACAELEMPVAIHPGFCNPGLDNQYDNVGDAQVVPFVFSLLLGYYAVVRSGLLDRYPNMRVAFMENGARWVDFLTMRMAEFSGKIPGRMASGVRTAPLNEAEIGGASGRRTPAYKADLFPVDYINRGQLFVNCEVDEEQLPFVVEQYGDDFLLFAADMWHGHNVVDPVKVLLERKDLPEQSKRKILVDNVARFYGLPVPQTVPDLAVSGD
jgi:predicted TIM-barrel fold metal-dependent hydrolase